ncbi:MAG: dihydroneopterin triphosphate 2'-epimerase [Pseudomonadota bacterium]
MIQRVATIRIQNLRLRTLVGFNPEERVKKQEVVINAEIAYTPPAGVFEDRVEEALNYKTITKAIIALVEGGQFLLLEKLVADVLEICTSDPIVRRASVTIDKPHALRFADSVSLTLEHPANPAAMPQLLEKAS